MDYLPHFIGSGLVIVLIIVLNSRRQKSRLKEFAIEPDEAPSILMIQSVERKLKVIYGKLFPDGVKPNAANTQAGAPATDKKLQLIKELEQLERAYAAKTISLKDYSEKLQNLQMKVIDL